MEGISQALLKHCEGVQDVLKWAEDLHAISEEVVDESDVTKVQSKSQ